MIKKLLIISIFLTIVCFIGWAVTFQALMKMTDLMENWQFQAVNCYYDLEMQKINYEN